jgi:hypothetical protein
MRVTIESNASELVTVLNIEAEQLPATIRPVVGKGSLNIKRDAQERIGRGPYLPMYARSISYDTWFAGSSVTSEIGPDKDKPQGPLGNLLEYGTGDTPPIPHLGPALDAEEPRFLRAIEDAVAKAIEG